MSKGTNIGKRRLSVFDLPTVDPASFSPQRRRRSSVFQGHRSSLNHWPKINRLSSNLKLHDWNRYGWHETLSPQGSKDGNIFITRSQTDIDDGQRTKSLLSSVHSSARQLSPQSLSLPSLPTNDRGDPMLRRPTLVEAPPIPEQGDLFKMLNKGKELKPFSFMGDEAKTNKFYDTHYPLLLGKLVEVTSKEPPSNRGLTKNMVAERLRQSTAERRLVAMRHRMQEADRKLSQLEAFPDGVGMVTVLKDDTFNPMTWKWNLKRYRIKS